MSYLNWFPGHMAKGLREIKEKQALVDCFIVLIDSRVPLSSYNEDFDLIAPNKPRLFVFSKSDFTNTKKISNIICKFNNKNDKYVVVNLKKNNSRGKILNKLEVILKNKRKKDEMKGLLKPKLRCFVIGMPNVGKSTLINLLSGSKKTKVANFAGTTRALQWVSAGNIQLLDTPGILMPKLINQEAALKLIACGLIKQELITNKDFYYRITDIINKIDQTKFKEIGFEYGNTDEEKYDHLVRFTRKNNFFLKNKTLDIEKSLSIFRNKVLNLKNICWD